jgi:hypothetical protein
MQQVDSYLRYTGRAATCSQRQPVTHIRHMLLDEDAIIGMRNEDDRNLAAQFK